MVMWGITWHICFYLLRNVSAYNATVSSRYL
ncbi:hypothetical protein SEVIR_1G083250v4 [Setaria viridis]